MSNNICQKCADWTPNEYFCDKCQKYALFDDVGTMEVGTKQECLCRLHLWLVGIEARILYTVQERQHCKTLTDLDGSNESLGFTIAKCEMTIEDL